MDFRQPCEKALRDTPSPQLILITVPVERWWKEKCGKLTTELDAFIRLKKFEKTRHEFWNVRTYTTAEW